jgi:hypothetical protein
MHYPESSLWSSPSTRRWTSWYLAEILRYLAEIFRYLAEILRYLEDVLQHFFH